MEKNKSMAQKVLENIQEDIINGVIKDGEIITERSFEQRYNVSRTPIKEALKYLETEGWVEIMPRQETQVTSFGIPQILETLPIRIALEGIATKLCIQNMNEQMRLEFEELLRSLEEMSKRINTGDETLLNTYNDLDNRFHTMLYHHSGSRILRNFSNSLCSLSKRTYRKILLDNERIKIGSSEIRQVITYILENEILLAEAAISKHIINSIDQKIRVLEEEEKRKKV